MGLDINGAITILAIVVYVVIFFIQKAQLNKQDKIIKSMESYVSSIDINKINDYVLLLDKRAEIKIEEIGKEYESLLIEGNLKPLIDKYFKEQEFDIKEQYLPKFKETVMFINFYYLKNSNLEKEEKIRIINEQLPKNKDLFIDLLN